ncbi:MAG: TonB-dependent receptor, partial [Bacteroidaceae bacterium]|nr:TonB-dependent receptor [Bacteroidaceae bacterium]
KMSSVLDITYKKPEKTEATVTASLLGGTAYLGTKKGNLSFSNAVRYKTSRYLLGTLETNGEYKPNYIDYQAYLSWKPNKKWDLDIIGNISENHYNFTPTDRETKFGTMNDAKVFKVYFGGEEKDIFRTYFGSLKLTRHLGDYTSVSLIGGIFKTEEKETFDITSQYWLNNQSEEESMGVGTDFEHTRNYLKAKVSSIELQIKSQRTHNTLLAGIKLKHEDIKEKSTEWIMRDSAGYSIPISAEALKVAYNLHSSNHITSSRLEAFVQNTYRSEIKPGIINLTYGVRLAYWNFNKELIVSPRVSLGLIPKFNDNFTFRIATGIYYQSPFYKEIRKVIETENGCEVTLNKDIKSQRSIHYVGGMDYKFRMLNRPFKFTTEVFYKSLSNLIPYSVDNVRLSYYGENVSDGYIAGIDMKLYGEFVKGTDSWISFSVMKANERINGTTVPLPTDQRYNLSLFFNDYFPNSTRWKMSLRCSLADGLPFGPPHSKREEQVFRAPAYKRVDIGMSYRLIKNEELDNKQGIAKYIRNAWIGIDAFNLLNISNVNSYYWITDVSNVKYAVPNYLTMRQINTRLLIEF